MSIRARPVRPLPETPRMLILPGLVPAKDPCKNILYFEKSFPVRRCLVMLFPLLFLHRSRLV